ncbi:transcriptional regulator (plasmid) [Deltaproteobacteria bacterium Smac51]|nr:transcriptional regulator [Deltaproteobacteria bacterium Smac51]
MKRIGQENFGETERPLETVRDLIKGKWKTVILWHLRKGPASLSSLEKSFQSITQKVLMEQLKDLVDNELVAKKTFPGYPLRVEYSLTPDRGAPLLEAMRIMQRVGLQAFKDSGQEDTVINMEPH